MPEWVAIEIAAHTEFAFAGELAEKRRLLAEVEVDLASNGQAIAA